MGEHAKRIEPEVGMGVTMSVGSDSYPGTITRVSKSGKTFWFREDDYKRVDNNGLSESQEYEYFPDESRAERKATLRNYGGFKVSNSDCLHVVVGSRRAYRDPHF